MDELSPEGVLRRLNDIEHELQATLTALRERLNRGEDLDQRTLAAFVKNLDALSETRWWIQWLLKSVKDCVHSDVWFDPAVGIHRCCKCGKTVLIGLRSGGSLASL